MIATVSSLYVAAITYDVCVLDVDVLTDVKADVLMYRSCRRMNVYFPGLTQIEARKQPEKT